MDVGVRELKAALSAYLKRAAAGERITVTDHGRPIAVLGPIVGRVELEQAAEEGWVQLQARAELGSVRRHAASGTAAQALDEDRDE